LLKLKWLIVNLGFGDWNNIALDRVRPISIQDIESFRKLSLKAFCPKIVSNLGFFADRLTILVEHQTLKSEMATQIVLPRRGSSSFQKFIFCSLRRIKSFGFSESFHPPML